MPRDTDIEADLKGYRLGEFLFEEQIGGGGFGAVWRCEQPSLKRFIAIKVLRREGEAAEARFLREAQLASRLDHPNVAHVHAFGVDQRAGFWIAMELVPGVSLDKWLSKHRRMSPQQLIPFFVDLVAAVAAAHREGIVHRDLKPANVMVIQGEDGRLIPKLLDLGVAREGVHADTIPDERSAELGPEPRSSAGTDDFFGAAPRITADALPSASPDHTNQTRQYIVHGAVRPITGQGVRIGTRHYMAPEQWDNPAAVGHASDQYALAVLAFELLMGRLPFLGDDSDELRAKHLYDRVPSLELEFSPEVDRVIRRALAKDRLMRFRSVTEFASELCAALRALPRGQLHSLAQVWDDAGRPTSLLLRGGDLLHMEGRSETERGFLAASRKHVMHRTQRRLVWLTVVAGSVAAAGAVALWSHLALKTQRAEQKTLVAEAVAETTLTQSALEQGRAELLHGEPGAAQHLAKAYQRDPKPTTAFMLSRALQPRLAEQARFASSSGQMWSAAFSPDGKQAVTTDDRNAQIWDVNTHTLRLTLPHNSTVFQAIFSSDGAAVISACQDGAVRIWDVGAGKLVRVLKHVGKAQYYYTITASPDGKLVAAMDSPGSVAHVWDLQTGALLAALDNEPSGFPISTFSSDGRWLATSGGRDVRVFEVRTWAQLARVPGARTMSWDPTGPRIVTGSPKGDVSIWEIPSMTRVRHLREVGESVSSVAYAPDGQTVVAASRDGAGQVWDALTGDLRSQWNYLHSAVRSIEFDPGAALTVAAGMNGLVAVVDAKQGTLVSLLEGPRSVVMSAHFDAHSQYVIAASQNGAARMWRAASPYRRWSSPSTAAACGVITGLEPDRRVVAVGCDVLPTRVWDTFSGKLLAELPNVVSAGDDFASALPAVSATGDRVAIARGLSVELYEVPGAKPPLKVTHSAIVNAVAFAGAGSELISGAVDGSVLVTRDGGAQLVLPRSSAGIDAVGFVVAGRSVVADAQRHLRLFDARGILLAELLTAARVSALRMSQDGRRLVTLPRLIGNPAPPELWDVETNKFIARLEADGQGHVWGARFAAGGLVITASSDGAARIWDSETGLLRGTYAGSARFLADAALSSDGLIVMGGDADGVLHFWDRVSGALLWSLPAHKSPLIGIFVEGEDIVTRGFSGDISRWSLAKPERVIEACGHLVHCATVFP